MRFRTKRSSAASVNRKSSKQMKNDLLSECNTKQIAEIGLKGL